MNAKNIKNWFSSTDIVLKMILIHILVYWVSAFFYLDFFRLDFALSAHFGNVLRRFWTFFTYSFVHVHLLHLIFNLLFLWVAGNAFLKVFNQITFFKFYLVGTLGAALIYLLGMSFLGEKHGYLYGSSAATMSVFFALAAFQPQQAFFVPFIGRVLFKNIALFFFAVDFFLLLSGSNIGGRLSHLGGAMAGFFYMRCFKLRKDFFKCSWFSFTNKTNVNRSKNSSKRTNRIIQKVSQSGYDSLTPNEKKALFSPDKNSL